mgnify:FL=1
MPYVNFKEENYKLDKQIKNRKENNKKIISQIKKDKTLLSGYSLNGEYSFKNTKKQMIGTQGVLKDEDLKHLNISRERGSDFVNLLSSVDEYKVWLAITENTKDHNWRVSMRSRHIPVNEIANKYRGGGHAFASGATLLSLDELPLLLNDIKERINE